MVGAGRPDVISGYGISTEAEGQLDLDWAIQRLTEKRNYWVCTTRADGRPHSMPVWGLWLDDAVWFSTDPDSCKGRNLAARPQLVIHLESGDEVVVVEGTAEYVEGTNLPAAFVPAYKAKYGHELDPSEPNFGFYRVAPKTLLAWRESDFPTSATRFTF
jgi:PPOX class probable F420-dependent enzyme